MTGFLDRPKGTLEDAIAGRDFDAVADWARYLDECNHIHMGSLLSVCRVVEEIGYVLSGTRPRGDRKRVECGGADRPRARRRRALVDEVQAGYETEIRQCEAGFDHVAAPAGRPRP